MKKLNDIILECLDWVIDRFSGLIVVGLFCLVLVLVFVAVYSGLNEENASVKLNLENWECANSKTYTTTTLMPSGKVMIPLTQVHNECVNYKRK